MSSCEKCWADAGGDADRYKWLLANRKPCSAEEQAGPNAGFCPECLRKTIHQHTGQPMCGCEGRVKPLGADDAENGCKP